MSYRTCLGACGLAVVTGWLFFACSSTGDVDPGGASGGSAGTGGFKWDGSSAASGSGAVGGSGGKYDGSVHKDLDADWDGKWPTSCGDSGVNPGPPPGGSPDCPDDLNLEFCPCHESGATAGCWTGERKNRNRGICHDGTTTCQKSGEYGLTWGPCLGALLPDPGTTTGPGACKCFSAGIWWIENLSPCFWGDPWGALGASSTVGSGAAADCDNSAKPPQVPSQPWSKNTLKVDCGGYFQLCYELKGGDIHNPQPTDCVLARVCVEGNYTTPGQAQPMPDLPAWSTVDTACSQQFPIAGYGEMSVVGMSVECDEVLTHVFHRVGYCPLTCKQAPDGPECKNCGNGQSGAF